MKTSAFLLLGLALSGCRSTQPLQVPARQQSLPGGSSFYQEIMPLSWQEREQRAVQTVLAGNIPGFLRRLVPIHCSLTDSSGRQHKAVFYVTPDYLCIGSDDDFARLPLTPMAAQVIADSLHCFLPTRKMTDAIYAQAVVKLPPVPMYALRDSAVTFWQHHLIIEGQRKQRKGLIAGIKKDVVTSGKAARDHTPNRVAIYGWHQLTGKAIQPLYTGHVNWYVDYSHGIRLVYRNILVNGHWMDYQAVLRHPVLSALLCDETGGSCLPL